LYCGDTLTIGIDLIQTPIETLWIGLIHDQEGLVSIFAIILAHTHSDTHNLNVKCKFVYISTFRVLLLPVDRGAMEIPTEHVQKMFTLRLCLPPGPYRQTEGKKDTKTHTCKDLFISEHIGGSVCNYPPTHPHTHTHTHIHTPTHLPPTLTHPHTQTRKPIACYRAWQVSGGHFWSNGSLKLRTGALK